MTQTAKKSPFSMNVDLMHGPIFKNLLLFMLPIFISSLFQQLYNTVDTMIVGNVLGDTALAAIGSCGSIYELLVGFGIGIGNGLAIVAARSYGAQDEDLLKKTVAGSLVIGFLSSLCITLAGLVGLLGHQGVAGLGVGDQCRRLLVEVTVAPQQHVERRVMPQRRSAAAVQPLAQLGTAIIGHHLGAQALVTRALQHLAQPGQPALVRDDGGVDIELRHELAGLVVEQHQLAGIGIRQAGPVRMGLQAIGSRLEQAAEKSHIPPP